MGIPHLTSTRTVHIHNMFSLKVSVVVCWLAMVGLEAKPAPALPVGSYSFSSQLGSNSIDQQQPALTTRTTSRGRVVADDYTSYLPVEDTPEVQDANEKFMDAFQQQIDLINDVREDGLWSVQPYADNYDYFEEAAQGGEYEGDEEDEDEEGDGEDEEDEEDEDDDEEDSDEEDDDDDSSSSSEEDSSSSEEDSDEEDSDEEDDDDEDDDDEDEDEEDEDEEDEDEEDEDDDDEDEDDDDDDEEDSDEGDDDDDSSSSSSSSEEDGLDSSSSSSSSSSSEEDGDPALLSMKALQALQPKQVEDTPEVEAAKKKFFDSYKAQLELVTNDIL